MSVGVSAVGSLADAAVHLRITGLSGGEEVTVTSSADDHLGRRWAAHAVFRADRRGTVDLDSATPLGGGSYAAVDGMGLFWAMDPVGAPASQIAFLPAFPEVRSSFEVRITVAARGRELGARTLTRRWSADGVTTRAVAVTADHVAGQLFLPPPGGPVRSAVLVFGGSEGGDSQKYTAALLASHGHPALAVAYFAEPGLPATLHDVPLEYFRTAAHLLAAQPGVGSAPVVAMGYSRGSEAALLIAEEYPDLVRGAVVYSPSAQVNGGLPNGGDAWTVDGRAVPHRLIPLDRVSGPVLAVAGADDRLWPSPGWAQSIGTAGPGEPARHALVYPDAGHGVGTFPYLSAPTRFVNPTSGRVDELGGTRAGNAAAQAAGWPQVLDFLDRVPTPQPR
ncbi:acyl-CoA thioesterase/bile acid-CoA:amino acid N-acyltransferase family protein [Kitasatospora sp. DSM 101779]|uniref:acyl-CoA thioesterase/bile acid-CoA:amino acid N-acyltransferase family protein n=1 Tax=Kitasatospora sp. DSM 101779 TaxID=2853165 RepID=UPI0021D993BE|nr:acyl-CoA thioesterase/bile acid-CoA:amino acid N-acyltransferase family protein [Kitasatospora sp. DSM 101779]